MPVKYTNKHGVPQEVVDAIRLDNHVVNGDISVTTLIDAPQIAQLKKENEYEVDITEMMPVFIGSAIHERLENTVAGNREAKALVKAASILEGYQIESGKNLKAAAFIRKFANWLLGKVKGDMVECTLTYEVDGVLVSGTFDRYVKAEKKIRDYKTSTAEQMLFPEQKDSWVKQQNIYALMARKVLGVEVEQLEIVVILKNWSKIKANTQKDYPKSPILTIPLDVYADEEVQDYMERRVALHKKAWSGEQVNCTNNERWAKADSYKVKSKGIKRAVRVFDNYSMAEQFVADNSYKYAPERRLYIETVPAESFRCAHYCPVKSICPQYKKEIEQKSNSDL